MNRHQRREAKAKAKNATVDPLVAVHEAGHALARYLTAEMMGCSEEHSVTSIVVHVPQEMPKTKSLDGQMVMSTGATTYGPMFSNEITAVSSAMEKAKGWSDLPNEERAAIWSSLENLRELMETAREQGCDVEKWLRARAVIAVAGAVAESGYRGVPWDEVWDEYESEDDMRSLVGDIMMSGVPESELATTVASTVDEAVTWFRDRMVGEPGAVDALNALAARIRNSGTIPGRTVVGIIRRAMEPAR